MARFFQSDGAAKGHPRTQLNSYKKKDEGGVGSPVLNEAQAIKYRVKLTATEVPITGPVFRVVGGQPGNWVQAGANGASNGSRIVVVSTADVAGYSDNGTTWTTSTIGGPTTGSSYRSIAYGNGTFVYVGSDGTIKRSTNGVTWTTVAGFPSAARAFLRSSLVFANGIFVAVAPYCVVPANNAANPNTVYISTDGETWTATSQLGFETIGFANGLFCAYGPGLRTSPDGITWTSRVGAGDYSPWGGYSPIRIHNNAIPGMFSLDAGGGGFFKSSNGVNWSAGVKPGGAALQGWVMRSNGKLFTSCGTNIAYSSDEGATWTTKTPPATAALMAVVDATDARVVFVAQYQGYAYISP
jgi:hypothetical protein